MDPIANRSSQVGINNGVYPFLVVWLSGDWRLATAMGELTKKNAIQG